MQVWTSPVQAVIQRAGAKIAHRLGIQGEGQGRGGWLLHVGIGVCAAGYGQRKMCAIRVINEMAVAL